MSQPNIILTGFMGTGKSTLGRILAARIGYQFIDTDQEIEKQAGMTVSELFQTQGEATFRRLETELVTTLAQRQGLVIATGGGLVLNPVNVQRLSHSGRIICLTASVDDILKRTSQQGQTRPLLQETDPKSKINELLRQRDPVYRQFPQLSTSDHSQAELIEQLICLAQSD